MLRFTVRRLVQLVPILLGLSLLVFVWVRALPGGPETALLGERATPQRVAEVKRAVRPRPPDPRAVRELYGPRRAAGLRPVHLDAAVGGRRDPASLPRHGGAGDRGDDLRDRPRHPDRLPCGASSQLAPGSTVDGRLAPWHLRARLLPRVRPQVRVRGQARLAAECGAPRRVARRRPPDGLLRPRFDHHTGLGDVR